jgi:hypothetical protein
MGNRQEGYSRFGQRRGPPFSERCPAVPPDGPALLPGYIVPVQGHQPPHNTGAGYDI